LGSVTTGEYGTRVEQAASFGVAVDHNVQGLACVRFVDPSESVLHHIAGQLGVSSGEPCGDPDICVTFVDRFDDEESLRLLELNNMPFAYSKNHFYLLDDKGYRTRLDFRQIGQRLDLVCERGITEIPLLTSLLSLTLIRKGHLMLHASAFSYRGKGILATGWQTGGKSEMLLAFMNAGAAYVSDDWTLVRHGDHKLCGLRSDVNIWNWQFEQLPLFRKRISSAAQRRLRLLATYRRVYKMLTGAPGKRKRNYESSGSMLRRLLAKIDREAARTARVSTSPGKLFQDQVTTGPVSLDVAFLANVVQDEPLNVVPVEPREVAERMLASQAYERRDLRDAYHKFRFAFPERAAGTLESLEAQELLLLTQSLGNRKTYEVTHPYPVSLADLYQVAEPFCR
jgi:hypothetical protein